MQEYWKVTKEMFVIALAFAVVFCVMYVVALLLASVISWVIAFNAILGWVVFIVAVFFLTVTIAYLIEKSDLLKLG